jgi:hypothetical protein
VARCVKAFNEFHTSNKNWIDFLKFFRLTEGIIGNIGPNNNASTTEVNDKLSEWLPNWAEENTVNFTSQRHYHCSMMHLQ